jgi:hypothetical protein
LGEVGQLGGGGVVEDVDFWPDLGAEETTFEDEGAEEVAVAVEVAVDSLFGYWVFVGDADI